MAIGRRSTRCSAALPRRAGTGVKRQPASVRVDTLSRSFTGAPDVARLEIRPIRHAEGVVALPGSKSISNRTLLLAALAEGATRLAGLLEADDTAHMIDALRTLGIRIDHDDGAYVVHGAGGDFPRREAALFLGNAGTAVRPLTAVLAMRGGDY